MTDAEVIEKIAQEWIDSGCDSEGFAFTQNKILDRIRSIERFNSEDGMSSDCLFSPGDR